jgi:hypothetical protein
METFKFFASNFTLIDEIYDTTGRNPHEPEAPIYQPEKRPLDAQADAARGNAADRFGVG